MRPSDVCVALKSEEYSSKADSKYLSLNAMYKGLLCSLRPRVGRGRKFQWPSGEQKLSAVTALRLLPGGKGTTEQIFVQEMFGCKWLIQDQSTITDSKPPLLCPHIFVNANGRRTTPSRSRDWDKRTTRFKNKFYTS